MIEQTWTSADLELDLKLYVLEGIVEVEAFLAKHAAFEAFCRERDRTSEDRFLAS